MASAPLRGDIVWLDFTPQCGREQAGRRPNLVLSATVYNARTGLAVMCPVTNQSKGYTFEVVLPPGLPVTGVVLADQLRSVDWRGRNAVFLCQVPDAVAAEVVERAPALIEQ